MSPWRNLHRTSVIANILLLASMVMVVGLLVFSLLSIASLNRRVGEQNRYAIERARQVSLDNHALLMDLERLFLIQGDQLRAGQQCIAAIVRDIAAQAGLTVRGVEARLSACRTLREPLPKPEATAGSGSSPSPSPTPTPTPARHRCRPTPHHHCKPKPKPSTREVS